MTTAYSFSSQLYIDGRRTDGESDARIVVRNPATEETIAEVPESSLTAVRRAIGAAREALLRMRHFEEIGDDAFHQVEEELDRAELSAQA